MNKKILITIIISLLFIVASCDDYYPRTNTWCEAKTRTSYFFDDQKCEWCQKKCYCSSWLGCTSCPDHYSKYSYSSIGTYCHSCTSEADSDVLTCCFQNNNTSAVRALSCEDGQLHGSYCHEFSHCLSYNEWGSCKTCEKGYFLNENQACEQCTSQDTSGSTTYHCSECSGRATCTNCSDGYYMLQYSNDDATAQNKASICKVCRSGAEGASENVQCKCTTNNTLCQSCINSGTYYYISDIYDCKLCTISGCAACSDLSTTGDEVCKTCKEYTDDLTTGYVSVTIDNKKVCKQCPSNCRSCKAIANSDNTDYYTSCNTDGCINGYYYVEGSTDDQTPSTCDSCSNADAYATRCDSLTKITQCQQTDREDEYYGVPFPDTTAYYVLTVVSDDGKTSTMKCQLNSKSCKRMREKPTSALAGSCKSCYDGYKLVETTSDGTVTSAECKTCSSISYCTECVVADGALSCTLCQTNNDISSWSGSADNYYVTTGSCTKCDPGCLACDVNGCTSCQKKYRYDTNTCTQCTLTNCKQCDAKVDVCEKCFDGYYLYTSSESQVCQNCEVGCKTCSSTRKSCTECFSGYYLRTSQCYPPVTNCVIHTKDGYCSYCKYGYRAVNGRCRSCSGGGYYANCSEGCTALRYTRDGIALTSTYNTKKNKEIQDSGSNASILIINVIITLFGLVVLFI